MRIRLFLMVLFAATLLAASPNAAQMVSIPGVFGTGLDANGDPLANGDLDPHYILTGGTGPATVINAHPAWAATPPEGNWVSFPGGQFSALPGFYQYTTTFDLSGHMVSTAHLSGHFVADNAVRVLLNGSEVVPATPGYIAQTGFNIATGFVPGVNTLTFEVENYVAQGANPTGLMITGLEVQAAVVGTPILSTTGLTAGAATDIILTGISAGARAGFAYSLAGPLPTAGLNAGPCLGLTVLLEAPIVVLGTATANASGTATLTRFVPATAAGLTIWMQAVVFTGCKLSTRIEEVVL